MLKRFVSVFTGSQNAESDVEFTMEQDEIFKARKYFSDSHASTVVKLNNGNLMSAFFAGPEEGHKNVRIWYSIYNGSEWSEPKQMASEDTVAHWNPVLANYGDFVRLYGSARLNYRQSNRKDLRRRLFNEVTVVAGNTTGKGLSITVGDSTMRFPAGENLVRAVFSMPDSSDKVSINVSGTGDIYGVLMDTKNGVAVDNIPMRGCSGTIFTAMNADQLRTYYDEENVRLIFLQYGGNSVPVIKNSKQVSNYCATMRKQINQVQGLAPNAKVVLIGPSDMGRRTWSMIPQLVDSLICTANSCGAAYWDIFGAMGGKYSMASWVSKGLAASDYIHFSTKGSKLMASRIAESFKLYYEYYLWRKENEE